VEFETLLRAYTAVYEKQLRDVWNDNLLLKQQVSFKEGERMRMQADLYKHTTAANAIKRLLAAAKTVAERPVLGRERIKALSLLDDAIDESSALIDAL
jgi:hypothetical protein